MFIEDFKAMVIQQQCKRKYKAQYVCTNTNKQSHYAFLCDQQCGQCQDQHQNCKTMTIIEFNQLVQQNRQNENVNSIIDFLEGQISNLFQFFKNQIEQSKKNFGKDYQFKTIMKKLSHQESINSKQIAQMIQVPIFQNKIFQSQCKDLKSNIINEINKFKDNVENKFSHHLKQSKFTQKESHHNNPRDQKDVSNQEQQINNQYQQELNNRRPQFSHKQSINLMTKSRIRSGNIFQLQNQQNEKKINSKLSLNQQIQKKKKIYNTLQFSKPQWPSKITQKSEISKEQSYLQQRDSSKLIAILVKKIPEDIMELDLSECNLQDYMQCYKQINIKKLKKLNISANRINQDFIKIIRNSLLNIQSLKMAVTNINNEAVQLILKNSPQLSILDISYTKINLHIVKSLAQAQKITQLYMYLSSTRSIVEIPQIYLKYKSYFSNQQDKYCIANEFMKNNWSHLTGLAVNLINIRKLNINELTSIIELKKMKTLYLSIVTQMIQSTLNYSSFWINCLSNQIIYSNIQLPEFSQEQAFRIIKKINLVKDKIILKNRIKNLTFLDNKKLKTLTVKYNQLKKNDLEKILECENLEFLNLSYCKIDSDFIKQLKNLRYLKYLILKKNSINDSCIKDLLEMQSLKVLSIVKTKITLSEVERLKGRFKVIIEQ